MSGALKNNPLEIKRLKEWSISHLPPSSTLRNVLLHEKDSISIEEFLIKIPIWLQLFDLESQR